MRLRQLQGMHWLIVSRLGTMLQICLGIRMKDSTCHNIGLSRMDVLARLDVSLFVFLHYLLALSMRSRFRVESGWPGPDSTRRISGLLDSCHSGLDLAGWSLRG
jgi:hypothetical protein